MEAALSPASCAVSQQPVFLVSYMTLAHFAPAFFTGTRNAGQCNRAQNYSSQSLCSGGQILQFLITAVRANQWLPRLTAAASMSSSLAPDWQASPARGLKAGGLDVVVLEARDRLGGRVHGVDVTASMSSSVRSGCTRRGVASGA